MLPLRTVHIAGGGVDGDSAGGGVYPAQRAVVALAWQHIEPPWHGSHPEPWHEHSWLVPGGMDGGGESGGSLGGGGEGAMRAAWSWCDPITAHAESAWLAALVTVVEASAVLNSDERSALNSSELVTVATAVTTV